MQYGLRFHIAGPRDSEAMEIWWSDRDDRDEALYMFEAEMNDGARILHIEYLSIACDRLIFIEKVEN